MAPPALDDCSRALLDAEADCDSASESLYEKSPWHRTLHKPQGFSFAFVLKLATTLFLIAATMALLIIQAAGRIASGRIHTSCGLPTDILFGESKTVILELCTREQDLSRPQLSRSSCIPDENAQCRRQIYDCRPQRYRQ